jgi:hypothetical protein
MTDVSLDHHLAELRQVAAELRAERQAKRTNRPGVAGSLRTALGRACLAAAAALLAEPGSPRLASR